MPFWSIYTSGKTELKKVKTVKYNREKVSTERKMKQVREVGHIRGQSEKMTFI